jgi:hypothetical protein
MDNFRGSTSDELMRAWDPFTHSLTMIGEKHRMIHDGFSYHCTDRAVSLANGADLDILLDNPAGNFPHINGILFSMGDSPCDLVSYEGVTTSASGTLAARFNRNRNSTNESAMLAYVGPTVTDLGLQVHDRFIPDAGGAGSNDVGVISPNFGEEWILKPATKYLVRLTNNSGGAITVGMEMLWYEVAYES